LLDKHQFPDGVDPYKTPGDPSSGLLWGISNAKLEPQGKGDKKVQTYNFRLCLTNDDNNKLPITKPGDYDPWKYELLLRYLAIKKPKELEERVLNFGRMPNHKTDINNNGPFSTDMIGMNYDYPEGDYETRKKITKAHESYIKGLLYFIGHDERVPEHLRKEMLQWGYPKDEFADNNYWSHQMYVREARRMTGAYVMTQHNCEGKEVVNDGIGMAAYTMDSHNTQRLVVNDMVKNEGDVQIGGFGPYPIAYRSLIPKAEECNNLLVPVCLSATHIAYGSIRMEPVFMVLGQSAAVAAAVAIDSKKPVQQVDVKKVQQLLKQDPLLDGSGPQILVDNDDKGVVVAGNWRKEKAGSYGPSRLSSNASETSTGFVQFIPSIVTNGKYTVYVYYAKTDKVAPATRIQVYDGQKVNDVRIENATVAITGQTSGQWVSLGNFDIKSNQKPYVKILSKGAEGIVNADAVLWIPEK
jgi:hypothetical protein